MSEVPSLVPEGWRQLLKPYRERSTGIAARQIGVTLAVYLGLWAAMLWAQASLGWLALLLCVPAAGFAVRLFILQHDCSHGSLFPSWRANLIAGYLLSVFTFTPFHRWRTTHLLHHARSSNLDERATEADIFTMTAREYLSASWVKRWAYRLFRHPVVLMGVLPIGVFLIEHRFAYGPKARLPEKLSILFSNMACVALLALVAWTVGLSSFFKLFLPMMWVATGFGVWLFYVQHQFTPSWWADKDRWSYVEAGMRGTSFYDLPRPLAWLTAWIGYHNVHHLDPMIPNYRLRAAHEANSFFESVPRLTLWQSLRRLGADCWDEAEARMVSIRELEQRRRGLG